MPKKIVARRVVPEADFMQLDFDAEPINTNKNYLFIYVNGEKLMIKKTDVNYTFNSWDEYLRTQIISLKPCNLLEAASSHKDMLYEIVDLKANR